MRKPRSRQEVVGAFLLASSSWLSNNVNKGGEIQICVSYLNFHSSLHLGKICFVST